MSSLRKVRVGFAALFGGLILLLFLDFTGGLHRYLSWLAEIQFVPSLLAHNFAIFGGLLILTALFGRIYCSVICPLGVFQDAVAHAGKRKKRAPYSFKKAKTILRFSVLGIFVLSLVFGVSVVVSLLDPYAAFGRFANNWLQPLWILGNNVLAFFAEKLDSYAFYEVDVWVKSVASLSISALFIIVVSLLAWRGGRTYCNTICPVGTFLGLISKKSLYKIEIDKESCVGCKRCVVNCKSACISDETYDIDNSRCVTCFNCLDKCPKSAIKFKRASGKSMQKESQKVAPEKAETKNPVNSGSSENRRGFVIAALAMIGSAAKAQVLPKTVKAKEEVKVDGGYADILPKKTPNREHRILPPGSVSALNFKKSCTACQLCVSACPNDVLTPSKSIDSLMQPEMSFNVGYCRPECVRCSEVCPSNAIQPIDVAEKSATQIGHAVWVESRCAVVQRGVSCDNCFRHCPTKAIQMVKRDYAHPVPIIDTERCIGCGACENLCPSRPLSAIYVEGHARHRTV